MLTGMTLIAGFLCPDGFVIAGDTEIELSNIRYQGTKLMGPAGPSTEMSYRLVIGGAGWTDYVDEVMQEIRAGVHALGAPLIASVDRVIREAIGRIHEENIFKHWAPSDPSRPNVSLIVGARDANDQRELWKTSDKTVSTISACAFIGSGSIVASILGEKLFDSGMPTAVVHHLATQILREAKLRGAGVGGNTDTWSVRTNNDTRYFGLDDDDKRYLWGLEDSLMSAIRKALQGREEPMGRQLQGIAERLKQLMTQASTPFSADGREYHTTEIGVPGTHPFRDYL